MLVSRISLDISSWYLASLLTHHVGISRRGPEPKASGNRGPEPKASGNRGLASNLAILSCGTPGSPWKPKEAQGAHGSPRKPKEPREPMEIGCFQHLASRIKLLHPLASHLARASRLASTMSDLLTWYTYIYIYIIHMHTYMHT